MDAPSNALPYPLLAEITLARRLSKERIIYFSWHNSGLCHRPGFFGRKASHALRFDLDCMKSLKSCSTAFDMKEYGDLFDDNEYESTHRLRKGIVIIMIIKKKRLLYTAAFIAILCCACSKQTAPSEENEITVNDSIAGRKNTQDFTVITQEIDKTEETDEATGQDDIEQNTQNNQVAETTDSPTASQSGGNYDSVSAHITFLTKEDSDLTDDGNLLYTSHCTYPVVEIVGNESAADKINTDIQTEVDAFLADTSVREWAKEDYQRYLSYLSNEGINSEYDFSVGYNYKYNYDFDIAVTRNDSNVISFLIKISS